MGTSRTGLTIAGGVVGGGAGLLLGIFAMYALANLVTKSRELQAYLTLVIVPSVGLLGAITGAALAAVLAGKRGAPLAVAALGVATTLAILALGAAWHHRERPANLTIRNDSTADIKNLFLGGDFRRNTRIGDLSPGQTSTPVPIDLARPETFNALEGRTTTGGGYVRHRLEPEETANIEDGNYLWIIGGADGALTYDLQRTD
ncbi:hypothetical protein L6R52_03015 [Myxococcota bacterium]|nr:hypothetical protein [Myxococcota bacterium]